MHQRLVLIYAIDHQSSSPSDVVDAVIRQLLHSGSLHNNVETVWIVVLEFLPLCLGVLAIKLDVFITSVEISRDVHLDALVSCDHDTGGPILLEKLGKDEAGRTSAQKEDFDANSWVELVEPMNGACSGLDESRLLIGDVVYFVKLLLLTANPC